MWVGRSGFGRWDELRKENEKVLHFPDIALNQSLQTSLTGRIIFAEPWNLSNLRIRVRVNDKILRCGRRNLRCKQSRFRSVNRRFRDSAPRCSDWVVRRKLP